MKPRLSPPVLLHARSHLARRLATCALFSSLLIACAVHDGKSGADGADGARGEKGPEGQPAAERSPQINLIEPHVGLVDRTVDVAVSFDGKIDLARISTIDFGDGVTVKKTSIAGNALVATLEIAPSAKLGRHDVTVNLKNETRADGTPDTAKSMFAKAAFVIAVPLDTKIHSGKAEQGGLVRLSVSNRDKIWFDTEKFRLFPLVKQSESSLVALSQNFTATDGTVVFLGDPLAKTGPLGFLGFNDPSDDTSASFLSEPDAVTVAARSPITLTSGAPIDKTFEGDLETGFYVAETSPTAKEGLLVEARANVPSDSTMTPLILGYPESGKAADLLDQGKNDPGFPAFGIPATEARIAYPVTAKTKAYFVVVDSGLTHGPSVKLSMSYTETRASIFPEKADPHGDAATAQNVGSLPGVTTSIPGRIVTGELKAADEVDVYKFTGLSATAPTDMLITISSAADVIVRVDTVPTFDSPNLLEVTRGGSVGSGTTASFVGKERYIQVAAKPDAAKQTGAYTLGIKRVAPVTQ